MGHFDHHCPMHSATAVMNWATLHRTPPTRFLPQEHHANKTDLIQGIDIPGGTDHTPPTMAPVFGDISTNHSHHHYHHDRSSSFRRHTSHSSSSHHSSLCHPWPIDAPTAIYAMTVPTGIVTSHSGLATSPMDISHTIITQTGASLTPATPTTLHRKHRQKRPNQIQDFQPHKPCYSSTVTIQDSPLDSSSGSDSKI